jgi:hypothetical protein
VFRIAASSPAMPILSGNMGLETDALFVQQYCATEPWFGDLTTGMFRLGRTSMVMHGLATNDLGMLALLRCYAEADRLHILQLLERASSSPSKFCYTTNIVRQGGDNQPVMCVGESAGFSDVTAGSLMGLFIFPRFHVARETED